MLQSQDCSIHEFIRRAQANMSQEASIEQILRKLEADLEARQLSTVEQLHNARTEYAKVASLYTYGRCQDLNGYAQGQYNALEMLRAALAQIKSMGLFDVDEYPDRTPAEEN